MRDSVGLALTATRHLGGNVGTNRNGEGFDVFARIQTQWRNTLLASVHLGQSWESWGEVGLEYRFHAAINEHLSDRRSALSTRYSDLLEGSDAALRSRTRIATTQDDFEREPEFWRPKGSRPSPEK